MRLDVETLNYMAIYAGLLENNGIVSTDVVSSTSKKYIIHFPQRQYCIYAVFDIGKTVCRSNGKLTRKFHVNVTIKNNIQHLHDSVYSFHHVDFLLV